MGSRGASDRLAVPIRIAGPTQRPTIRADKATVNKECIVCAAAILKPAFDHASLRCGCNAVPSQRLAAPVLGDALGKVGANELCTVDQPLVLLTADHHAFDQPILERAALLIYHVQQRSTRETVLRYLVHHLQAGPTGQRVSA